MSESTEIDVTHLDNEDTIRTFMLLVTPLIQQAVAAAIPPELSTLAVELSQARQELATAKADFEEAKSRYITAEEAEKIGKNIGTAIQEPLRKRIDEHLKELAEEDTRRNQAFDQRIGELNAEIIEARQQVMEADKKLATMEAAHLQRFEHLDRRLTRAETDIDKNVKKVADSANTMNLTFAKFLEKYEKKIGSIESDVRTTATALKKQAQDTGRELEDLRDLRGEDVKEMRRIENRLNTESTIVRDIEGRVMLDMTRWNAALYGDKEKGEPGLVADVRTMKRDLIPFTWLGSHPRYLIMGCGLLYVLALIVMAAILGKPEIVAAFIPNP